MNAAALDKILAVMLALTPQAQATAQAATHTQHLRAVGAPTQFVRYLHNQQRDAGTIDAVVMALNTAVSQTARPYRPQVTADKSLIVVDLAELVDTAEQLEHVVRVWESLAFIDPYFHLGPTERLIDVPTYTHANGKRYSKRWQKIAAHAPHIGPSIVELSELTNSQSPILDARWLVVKSLSTLNGGAYYDFIDIRGRSQTQYLKSRGIDLTDIAARNTDERVVVQVSGVTNKPRRIDFVQGSGAQVSRASGIAAITKDVFNTDIAATTDALRMLDDGYIDRGREVILERANGWHEFTLWDAGGNLVDSVPDQIIAGDAGIPKPFHGPLQPAIGCIRCHGPDDGWRPFDNAVHRLLDNGFDFFGDVTAQDIFDSRQRQRSLYAGHLGASLDAARNTYNTAVATATGKGAAAVREVSQSVADVFAEYEYTLRTAYDACYWLGIETTRDDAPRKLREGIVPPAVDPVLGVAREDPVIIALLSGLPITPTQFEVVFTDLAVRLKQ